MPASSVTIRIVEVPPTSTVYSNVGRELVMAPMRRPAAAPPMVRNAWLLPDWLEPDASPIAPPIRAPPVWALPDDAEPCVTAVMRP